MTRQITPELNTRIKKVIGQTLKNIYPEIDMISFIWLAQQIFEFLLDCCEDEFLVECDQEEEPVAFNSCFNSDAVVAYIKDQRVRIYEIAPRLKEWEQLA